MALFFRAGVTRLVNAERVAFLDTETAWDEDQGELLRVVARIHPGDEDSIVDLAECQLPEDPDEALLFETEFHEALDAALARVVFGVIDVKDLFPARFRMRGQLPEGESEVSE